ncbi:TlpA family protein disulfide reductase [Aquabacterium sp. A7-Y]|uniref:TlpA disulfide reductase family protein n=1 Tax=Aquabacterium sp. A7-Y TaxID=1349605 RepID=UPI00223E40DB|nr:TlpA disulfide reductase family protein [Aquabacterium sp. A7-Y]MCW7538222.1 TlpA family protein disulfide reductase [Aquabacterium sp. A7-Y]
MLLLSLLPRPWRLGRCWCAALVLLGLAGTATAQALVRPWPDDRVTPALTLRDLDGKPRTLAELRGKVVVINFWASWCEPCVAELPSLLRLAERHAGDGLVVLAPNYQEGEAKVRAFFDTLFGELPESLPVLLDRDGAAARAWTRRVFPSTVLVDRSGQARWSVIGELDWSGGQAQALLGPLLQARRP